MKGSGCEHMKFLTFDTSLNKFIHPKFNIYKWKTKCMSLDIFQNIEMEKIPSLITVAQS